ncbi:hypothetical protein CEXT_44041 [Caerostris extrusa]|uniref:Uncharacterized protein n=1 Tax=Caerostris extrusa TaxID=172846 RepID=A0AAV4NER9_CAEEX|nr:hypothetical protein CEXT_44041 [Caerostris extrusa]
MICYGVPATMVFISSILGRCCSQWMDMGFYKLHSNSGCPRTPIKEDTDAIVFDCIIAKHFHTGDVMSLCECPYRCEMPDWHLITIMNIIYASANSSYHCLRFNATQ